MGEPRVESAIGLFSSGEGRTLDSGAGLQEGLVVVTDGIGGHCTGWLGVLLSVRPICERFARPGESTRFVGAAADFPDDWGWAGAMQSRAAAERVYRACLADFGDLAALPRDLQALFFEIDRVIHNVPSHGRINGLLAGCIAARIEGTRVQGVHAGIGRALLLRAGAPGFEPLVTEHYWHLVSARLAKTFDVPPGVQIPRNVIVNALGCLSYAGLGIDRFDVDLGTEDLLLILSRHTHLTEDGLAQLIRASSAAGAPLDDIARAVERHAAETVPSPGDYTGREFAFALLRARPAET